MMSGLNEATVFLGFCSGTDAILWLRSYCNVTLKDMNESVANT